MINEVKRDLTWLSPKSDYVTKPTIEMPSRFYYVQPCSDLCIHQGLTVEWPNFHHTMGSPSERYYVTSKIMTCLHHINAKSSVLYSVPNYNEEIIRIHLVRPFSTMDYVICIGALVSRFLDADMQYNDLNSCLHFGPPPWP